MYQVSVHPLRMNPLRPISAPPDFYPATIYGLPHASTSSERIISPLIIIPGHDPLSTTLTPQQLSELFPVLRIYVNPSQPSLAILPSSGILSYTGCRKALRWREAEIRGTPEEETCTLTELVHMYQALAFLGNKSTSRTLWALRKSIMPTINETCLQLTLYQDLWALRGLPFTAPFILALVKSLARMEMVLSDVMAQPDFQCRFVEDAVFAHKVDYTASILRWVYADLVLKRDVGQKRLSLQLEAKWVARMEKRGGISAVARYRAQLEPVLE